MKKGKIQLRMGNPPTSYYTVDAYIMSEQWAIHHDINSSQFVLTHIPSGKRVWSAKTQTALKRLIQEPEFLEPLDDNNIEQITKLARAIERFCESYGWV